MSDIGESWKVVREESIRKRQANRQLSAAVLEKAGIPFEVKNAGAHLIVESGQGKIDFWPGTGKWKMRSGREGRGVKELVKAVKETTA